MDKQLATMYDRLIATVDAILAAPQTKDAIKAARKAARQRAKAERAALRAAADGPNPLAEGATGMTAGPSADDSDSSPA